MDSQKSLQHQLSETFEGVFLESELVDGPEVQNDLEMQIESLNSNLQFDEDMPALVKSRQFDCHGNTADERPTKRQRTGIDFVDNVV
jgi:hypothetical protein